jgi:flagellar biosynthesis GTPase FlhF
MFYLACISFNNKTYDENICYRNNKCNKKVIYGSMLKIREIYPTKSLIFIAEMNNSENKIEGIGLIKNILVYNRKHKIHENNECNRYIYQGKYWLSRTQILEVDFEILTIFDDILFKGKSHLKNRIGIRIITDNLFVNWNSYDLTTLKNKVKNVFNHYFQKQKKEEEYLEIVLNKQNLKIKKKKEDKKEQQEQEKDEEEYLEIVLNKQNLKIKKKKEEQEKEEDKKEQQEKDEEEYLEIVLNKQNLKIKKKKEEQEKEYLEIVLNKQNLKIKKKKEEQEKEEEEQEQEKDEQEKDEEEEYLEIIPNKQNLKIKKRIF